MPEIHLNKDFKATIFEMIFRDKNAALSLYNAINNTNYTNASELQITTLNDALYMGMKNDVSFIIDFVMNLYEHQSTFNPNMPLRGLFYFARLYEAYIKENRLDIFSSTRLNLPIPQYIVFYNGEREQPEKRELHLTDSFSTEKVKSHLEVTAIMYNINFGKNKELMQKCQFLQEYAIFISVVRGFRDMGYTYERTLEEAVKKCIEENVLREFLIHNKAGVLNMILSEYDEKLHIENEKRIALEKAQAEWELHVESEKRIAVEEAQAQWRLHAQEQIQLAVNEAHTQWQLHTQEQIQLAVNEAHTQWQLHTQEQIQLAVNEAQAQWRLHAQEQIQLAVNEAQAQWRLHAQEQIQLAVNKALEAEHLKTEKEQQRAREAEELLVQTADALQRAQAEIEMLKKKLNE